ncbi:hypothetical protein [Macrococcus sp. DPC7161]|uniref:hypothetical protein n=1 Tax=Macrococcus sp. DPC7161 TaxID=2507060 RepID=UPI00100B991C|nr:hypothetical protein [Macrococcus sp. DPC7161]RXK18928.1 hypothetical protein ER639_01060 [Macrococcus sp. DPC7161]
MQPTRLDGKPYTREELEGMYKSALKRENVKRHNKYKLDDNATSDSFFKFVDREVERLEKENDRF